MTSSNNPLNQIEDQAPAALDDLVASVLSGAQGIVKGLREVTPPFLISF